jgi:mono/diheme cytochrome c family protein
MRGHFILAVLSLVASTAMAQQPDPATGKRIAEQDCASCHAVHRGDDKSPVDRAPSFDAIAALPSTNELSLRVFLRTSHAGMPNIMLRPEEIDPLIAYVVSLKPPR